MVKAIPLSISATTLLLLPLAARGEEVFTDAQWSQSAAAKPATTSTTPVGSPLLAIAGSLVFVILLAVALGWLVKRLGVKRLVRSKGAYLEVIESVPLGFKRQASLIRLGDIVVLVGVGEHELTTLATLPAASVLREGPAALVADAAPKPVVDAPAAPIDPTFRSLLTKVLKG